MQTLFMTKIHKGKNIHTTISKCYFFHRQSCFLPRCKLGIDKHDPVVLFSSSQMTGFAGLVTFLQRSLFFFPPPWFIIAPVHSGFKKNLYKLKSPATLLDTLLATQCSKGSRAALYLTTFHPNLRL